MTVPHAGVPESLTAYLDTRTDALEALTLDLLSFDTQNPPGETTEMAAFVRDYLGDAGIDTESVTVDPAKPNLVAEIPGRRDATLLFNGHLDTVPYDEDAWDHNPLGTVEGDRIYGRGATDMKGPLAAMLEVMRAFSDRSIEPPVNLALAVVSDEEVPSEAGVGAVLDAEVLDADACVIGETTCEAGRFSLTVADKGSIWLTLEATGEAAHGSRPVMGENAIDAVYRAVEDLRDSLSQRPIEIDTALEPTIQESIEYYEPTVGQDAAERLFRYPTVNLGRIGGGESINAVPERAEAGLDVRLTAGVDTETVLADIRTCLDRHDGVRITESSWSIGTYEPAGAPLVTATAETATEVIGERDFLRSATGGGDAKRLRNAGISTVEFGVGTETVHAVDEFITSAALAQNAQIYSRLPYRFAAEIAGE